MKKILLILPLLLLLSSFNTGYYSSGNESFCSTFSIVGFDPVTGDLGVAVQSKFPNVRPVVPWAKAGVGAVATQSFAKLDYATKGLELMEKGLSAKEALEEVLKTDPDKHQRQVGIVDAKGNAASWTGDKCFDWGGGAVGKDNNGYTLYSNKSHSGIVITGKNFTAQGNILVSEETVKAMAESFENTKGSLPEKLMAALTAGGKAGGDKRGEQSAALLVVRKNAGYDGMDNYIDISVYDHKTPIAELNRLFKLNNLYFTPGLKENLLEITPSLAKEIKQIMFKRGFIKTRPDNVIDKTFQQQLSDFMGWENYDIRIETVQKPDLSKGEKLFIDKEVLNDMRKTAKIK